MRRWTDEEIARLKALAQKRRATQIAIELGRSASEVHRKARELGLSLRLQPAVNRPRLTESDT